MDKTALIKKENVDLLENTLKDKLKNFFKENDKIAVKLHMGEAGNKYYVKPDMVKIVIKVLKDFKTKPFLFDSPVIYAGSRDTTKKYLQTAKKHGFSEDKIGCPIVISNKSVKVKTKNMEVEVCREIAEADGMFVLSHVKGHMCSGFGGAIKNLGMGCVSVNSKKQIHTLAQPVCSGECSLCGNCVKICPVNAVSINNNKLEFDYNFGCWGCGLCIANCPNKAIKNRKATFDELLAEGACAVLSRQKKAFYMNVIMDVTELCDCCSDPGRVLIGDIGILLGKDIAAIDKASVDLINKKAGKDLFKEVHKKSPLLHVREFERLGSQNYAI